MHVTGTTPYPWPWDGSLAGPGTALLVLLPPTDGALPADVRGAVLGLALALRRAGGPVITVTTTTPARLRGRAVTGGGARDVGLAALLGDPPDHHVDAGGLDAFYASDLDLLLGTRGIRRLLLAGHGLETGVHSTMRDANDRGYECLLVVDACVPVDPDLVGPAISMIEMSGGIFGAVGRTAAVVAALEAGSAHSRPSAPVPATTSGDL